MEVETQPTPNIHDEDGLLRMAETAAGRSPCRWQDVKRYIAVQCQENRDVG